MSSSWWLKSYRCLCYGNGREKNEERRVNNDMIEGYAMLTDCCYIPT